MGSRRICVEDPIWESTFAIALQPASTSRLIYAYKIDFKAPKERTADRGQQLLPMLDCLVALCELRPHLPRQQTHDSGTQQE